MRQILLSLALILSGLSAQALEAQFAVGGGIKTTSIDAKVTTTAVSDVGGYQLGAYGFFPFTEEFQFRTAFLYSQRAFSTRVSNTDYDVKLAYVDIPITAMYRFSEFGGVYAGPVMSFLQGKDFDRTQITGAKSTIVPFTIGVNFRFMPQVGVDLFYEVISSSVTNDYENMRSFGASLVIYFE